MMRAAKVPKLFSVLTATGILTFPSSFLSLRAATFAVGQYVKIGEKDVETHLDSDTDSEAVSFERAPQIIYVQDVSLGFTPYHEAFGTVRQLLSDYHHQFPRSIFSFVRFGDALFCEDDGRNWCYSRNVGWTDDISKIWDNLYSQTWANVAGDRDGALDALYRVPYLASFPFQPGDRHPAVMIMTTDGHLQYNPLRVPDSLADWHSAEPSCNTTGPKLSFRQLVSPFKEKLIFPVIITGSDANTLFWRQFINAVGTGQVIPIDPRVPPDTLQEAILDALVGATGNDTGHLPYRVQEKEKEEGLNGSERAKHWPGVDLFPSPLLDPLPICEAITAAFSTKPVTQPVRKTATTYTDTEVDSTDMASTEEMPDRAQSIAETLTAPQLEIASAGNGATSWHYMAAAQLAVHQRVSVDRSFLQNLDAGSTSSFGPEAAPAEIVTAMLHAPDIPTTTTGSSLISDNRATVGTIVGAAVGGMMLAGGVVVGVFARVRGRSGDFSDECLAHEANGNGSEFGNPVLSSTRMWNSARPASPRSDSSRITIPPPHSAQCTASSRVNSRSVLRRGDLTDVERRQQEEIAFMETWFA